MLAVGCHQAVAPAPDAFDPCARPGAATMVHATLSPILSGSSATITFPPTSAGNLSVFMFVQESGADDRPFHALMSTGGFLFEGQFLPQCGRAFQVSGNYLGQGTTSADVKVGSPGTFQVYALELAGMASDWPQAVQGISTSSETAEANVPAANVCQGDVVVSMILGCGDLGALSPADGFMDAGETPSGDLAYTVTTASGTISAVWTSTAGPWSAETLVFGPPRSP